MHRHCTASACSEVSTVNREEVGYGWKRGAKKGPDRRGASPSRTKKAHRWCCATMDEFERGLIGREAKVIKFLEWKGEPCPCHTLRGEYFLMTTFTFLLYEFSVTAASHPMSVCLPRANTRWLDSRWKLQNGDSLVQSTSLCNSSES